MKVNNDGHFVNDLSGTRGVYQAGIRAIFTENLSGQLSSGYGNGANIESPWSTSAGISWTF
ncbi:autotransporter outer membrane beta-barrel domain-containing protein [Citrobacter freundii]|nr:autotransporter outer membrane beta-barrel domain-containing protein [Citrobacter freundii]